MRRLILLMEEGRSTYLQLGDLPATTCGTAASDLAHVFEDARRITVMERYRENPVGKIGRHAVECRERLCSGAMQRCR